MPSKDLPIERDVKSFGFWVYLMTDLVIFGVLFATFIVLRDNTFNGPTAKDLFSLPQVLAQTLVLLISTFTCSLATMFAGRKKVNHLIISYLLTLLLGLVFLALELREFSHFIEEGASWKTSAFLSSYFALVGTHGLHIGIGIVWMLITLVILSLRGILDSDLSRISRLSLYWHFLDIVWIYIFTVVYLMGIL